MGRLVGTDEAGYGPNLGPLLITATSWSVPEDPPECDLFDLLEDAVARTSAESTGRLHVADSKEVYSPGKGLGTLEVTALALLRAAGKEASSFHSLWRDVAVHFPSDAEQEPWFAATDIPLPFKAAANEVDRLSSKLESTLERADVARPQIATELVLTERFNRLTSAAGSKGVVLSNLTLRLLRTVWDPDLAEPTLVVCDKHGGRNRYDLLLSEVIDGAMILRLGESRQCSIYRIGSTELRFQTKAEEHFPVAAASIVSKYLRELAMIAFNRFWQQHLPELRPTKGYPADAKRFRSEISEKQQELEITDNMLWRNR